MKSTYIKLTLILSMLVLASACSINNQRIIQGKLIDPSFLELVKPGMSTEQVRATLGSPAIIDAFTPNKWVYFYSKSDIAKKKVKQQGKLILIFKHQTLSEIIDGQNITSEKSSASSSGNTIITKPTQKKRGIFN